MPVVRPGDALWTGAQNGAVDRRVFIPRVRKERPVVFYASSKLIPLSVIVYGCMPGNRTLFPFNDRCQVPNEDTDLRDLRSPFESCVSKGAFVSITFGGRCLLDMIIREVENLCTSHAQNLSLG